MSTFPLKIQNGVDHMLEDTRSGNLSFFCHVTNKHDNGTGLFGEADERLSRGPNLCDGARRGFERVHKHRLDRIHDDDLGLFVRFESRKDVADVGCGSQSDRRVGQCETSCAHADLINGFLA